MHGCRGCISSVDRASRSRAAVRSRGRLFLVASVEEEEPVVSLERDMIARGQPHLPRCEPEAHKKYD